jgi:hypothetical protein
MKSGRGVLSLLAGAALLAGCGGSGHKAGTTSTAPLSRTPVPHQAPTSGIRTRLLTNNELAGFQVARVSVYTTLAGALPGGQPPARAAAEKAMLTRNGFRIGAREDLMNAGTPGLSLVEQFRSPSAARAELGFEVSQSKNSTQPGATYAPLKVSGIPGAVGFSLGGPNGGGINIAFTDGAYYYLVGQIVTGATSIANLTAAAQHLYHRVHR